MNIFNKLKAYLTYREAVSLADAKHQSERCRFYVMASEDAKLVVMSKQDMKYLKKINFMSKKCHAADLDRESFYHTAMFNENNPLTEEEIRHKYQMFLRWYDVSLKVMKVKKRQAKRNK